MTTNLHTNAFSRADEMTARAIEKRRIRTEADRLAPTDDGFSNSMPTSNAESLRAERAYEHYRGWVYAALRPIVTRISSQPVCLGRVVKATREKYNAAVKAMREHSILNRGKRLLSDWEIVCLPKHVRRKFGFPTHDIVTAHDKERMLRWVKAYTAEQANVEIIEEHPIHEALSDPNQRMIYSTLMASTIPSIKMTGKGFWWLAKSNRRPKQPYDIWPLPTHWITPKNEYRLEDGWIIKPPRSVNEGLSVDADKIIFFNMPDPSNPFQSLAEAGAGIRAIQTDESIQESQYQGFNNGIVPGLAVITGDIMSPEGKSMGKAQLEDWQINQIYTRMDQMYRGVEKSRRMIVLDRLIADVKEITRKNAEMDWLDSGQQTKARIFQIFGVNPIVAGEIENANRAQAVVADESFIGNVVNPDLILMSQVMNDGLLPIFTGSDDSGLMLWIEEARANDPEMKMKQIDILTKIRGVTVDEVRAEFGKPPLENDMGQVLPAPMTLSLEPADGSMEETRRQGMENTANPPELNQEEIPEDDDEEEIPEDEEAEKSYRKSIKAYADAWLKLHGRQEKLYAADLQRFFQAQADMAAKNVMRLGVSATVDKLLPNLSGWTSQLKNISKIHLLRAALAGAEIAVRGNRAFKADDDDLLINLPEEVRQVIQDTLRETMRQKYWQKITKTSRQELRRALQKSQDMGETLAQTVVRVKAALGGEAAKIRAIETARTETTGALNSGSSAVIDRLTEEGTVAGKEWLDTKDEHERDSHLVTGAAPNNVADKDGMFKVGTERAPYPGYHGLSAKERINCRCTVIARRKR